MLDKPHFNTKSIALVASVSVLALLFGVMLDERVVSEPRQSVMTEAAGNSDKDSVAATATSSEHDIASIEQKQQQQSARLTELDQKAKTTIEKAEDLSKQADQLIVKANLSEPAVNKEVTSENKKLTKRLADAHGRLDALKEK